MCDSTKHSSFYFESIPDKRHRFHHFIRLISIPSYSQEEEGFLKGSWIKSQAKYHDIQSREFIVHSLVEFILWATCFYWYTINFLLMQVNTERILSSSSSQKHFFNSEKFKVTSKITSFLFQVKLFQLLQFFFTEYALKFSILYDLFESLDILLIFKRL